VVTLLSGARWASVGAPADSATGIWIGWSSEGRADQDLEAAGRVLEVERERDLRPRRIRDLAELRRAQQGAAVEPDLDGLGTRLHRQGGAKPAVGTRRRGRGFVAELDRDHLAADAVACQAIE